MKLLIPDFDAYQHYSDRRPPWVKIPRKLLAAYAFRGLAPGTRFIFVGLLILANENPCEEGEGVVEASTSELAFDLGVPETDAINGIAELDDAALLRVAP